MKQTDSEIKCNIENTYNRSFEKTKIFVANSTKFHIIESVTVFLKRVVREYKMLIEKMDSKIQDIYDLLASNNLLETYAAKKRLF